MYYNGAKYFFIKDLQGDVVQLRGYQNNLIANYEYDAYGKPISITDASGNTITNTSHIALVNPIRYRGYYYDNQILSSKEIIKIKIKPKTFQLLKNYMPDSQQNNSSAVLNRVNNEIVLMAKRCQFGYLLLCEI